MDKIRHLLVEVIDILLKENYNIHLEIIVLMKTIDSIKGCCDGGSRDVKVLRLKSFNDTWNAKKLENFIWDIEQYFTTTHILNIEKFAMTNIYLIGDAFSRRQIGETQN